MKDNHEDDKDARLSRAAMKAADAKAPEELKVELKRMAARRRARPEPGGELWTLLSGAWRPALGAAFAAAAVTVALWKAVPEGARTPAPAAAPATDDALERLSRELWADDDGRDDEI